MVHLKVPPDKNNTEESPEIPFRRVNIDIDERTVRVEVRVVGETIGSYRSLLRIEF